jgi:hypothetical protein
MTTSYNGWPASRDASAIGIKPFVVAERSFPGGVKGGDVATVLRYVAAQYHVFVESLYFGDINKDDWGYSYRPNVNNPSELSCHASGTAIDVNADQHPNGVRRTHSYAQVRQIRRIIRECGYGVRWGGDFPTADEMHFEIHGTRTAIATIARRLRHPEWYDGDLRPGDTGDAVKMVQRRLGVRVTGKYDANTAEAVKRFRAKLHLSVNTLVNKDLAYLIGAPA